MAVITHSDFYGPDQGSGNVTLRPEILRECRWGLSLIVFEKKKYHVTNCGFSNDRQVITKLNPAAPW